MDKNAILQYLELRRIGLEKSLKDLKRAQKRVAETIEDLKWIYDDIEDNG